MSRPAALLASGGSRSSPSPSQPSSASPHSGVSSTPSPSPSTPRSAPTAAADSITRSLSAAAFSAAASSGTAVTTTGSGRSVGIGPAVSARRSSQPTASSSASASALRSNPSIGSSSFPLLPRLEDVVDAAALLPNDDGVHSLTAILNDPLQPHDPQPLPLVIGPLPWTDKELHLQTVVAQCEELAASFARFQRHHGESGGGGGGAAAPGGDGRGGDDGEDDGRRAAEQLRHCLSAVPARFFAAEFDEIEEAFSFMQEPLEPQPRLGHRDGDAAGAQPDSGRENSGSAVDDSALLPPASSSMRGASQYDPKTQMYVRPASATPSVAAKQPPAPAQLSHTPPPQPPAPYPPPAPSPPAPAAAPVISTTRSILSYIASAFTSTPMPTFTVPAPSPPPSSFLSSRRFASLTLSPAEEQRAAVLLSSLSSYLDTLEVTLTSQIQLRSASFFSSLLTIHSLDADTASILQHIELIRLRIVHAQRRLTLSALRVVRRTTKKRSLTVLAAFAHRLLLLSRSTARCQRLVEERHYTAVLACMHSTRIAMYREGGGGGEGKEGQPAAVTSLRELKAVQALEAALQRTLLQVQAKVELELLDVALHGLSEEDEERKVEDGSSTEKTAASVSALTRPLRGEEQERVFELSQCLYHVNGFPSVLQLYETRLLAAMKDALQRHIDAATGQPQLHITVASQSSSPASASHSAASALLQAAEPSRRPSIDITGGLLPSASPPASASSTSAAAASSTSASQSSPSSSIVAGAALSSTASPQRPTDRRFSQALSAILPARLSGSASSASAASAPNTPPPPRITVAVPASASAISADPPPAAAQAVAHSAVSSPSSDSSSAAALARYVSAPPHGAYLDFLRSVFSLLLSALHRVVSVRSVAIQAIACIPTPLFLTETTVTAQYAEDKAPASLHLVSAAVSAAFASLISAYADWAHSECSRIVALRPPEQQLSTLSSLLSTLSAFISETESITQSPVAALRVASSSLSASYISGFHAFHSAALLDKLEHEQWARVDVPRDFQQMIDSQYGKKVATIDPPQQPPAAAADAPAAGGAASASPVAVMGARVFFVENTRGGGESGFDKYPVVASTLALLHSVSLYSDLAARLPSSAAEVGERLLQLLALFNAKTRSLILGAGALKAAGLKTITTTHLALAAQCIGLILTQLPTIASRFPPPPPSPASTSPSPSLPQLVKEYGLHQRELLSKLESIMSDIADAAFKRLIPALAGPPVAAPAAASGSPSASTASDDAGVDPVLKTLMTQTRSLNSSLSAVLSLEQRRQLFSHLCAAYCAMLGAGVRRQLEAGRDGARGRAAAMASWMMKQFYLLPGQDLQAIKDIAALLHIADIPLPQQPDSMQPTAPAAAGAAAAAGSETAAVRENGVSKPVTPVANGSEAAIDSTSVSASPSPTSASVPSASPPSPASADSNGVMDGAAHAETELSPRFFRSSAPVASHAEAAASAASSASPHAAPAAAAALASSPASSARDILPVEEEDDGI